MGAMRNLSQNAHEDSLEALNFLSRLTEKFTSVTFQPAEDRYGFYFPDSVIASIVSEVTKNAKDAFDIHLSADKIGLAPLNKHKLLIPEEKFTLEESCNLVIAAFEKFDLNLAMRAKKVIANKERWILSHVKAGEAEGRCYLANSKVNPKPYAVIEYSYDGTINDAVYIAHELGHLIADDYINEAGGTCEDTKVNMAEVQGFFTQHILYDYLAGHPDVGISRAGEKHFLGEITRFLYAILVGVGELEAEKSMLEKKSNKEIALSYSHALQSSLGDKWKEYGVANRVFHSLLNGQEGYAQGVYGLHTHPMASLIAKGLFLYAKQIDRLPAEIFVGTLYGAGGSKDTVDVIMESGIENQQEWERLVKRAVEQVIEPLTCRVELDRNLESGIHHGSPMLKC